MNRRVALALFALVLPGVARGGTPIGTGILSGLVVDQPRRHVFVTLGDDSIEVFDFDGNPVTSIGGQTGAGAMVLDHDRLYVAQRTGSAIVEIDARRLRERRRIPLAVYGGCVESVGLARHRVWFGFSCSFAACPCVPGAIGGLGSVDRRGGTRLYQNFLDYPYYWPLVTTDPHVRSTVVATDRGLSPMRIRRYDVDRTGVLQKAADAEVPGNGGNLQDVALSPLGDRVLVASGAPYYVNDLRLADLAAEGTYPTGPYPTAVAVTRDGRHLAAGVNAHYDPDVYVFPVGSNVPINVLELSALSPASPDLVTAGLAFDRTGTRLFAVTGGGPADPKVLHVLAKPLEPATSTTTTSTSTSTSSSSTSTTSPYACGGGFPFCGGPCAAGETCVATVVGGVGLCECAPDPACGDTGGGVCGGGCAPGRTCVPIHLSTCGCSD